MSLGQVRFNTEGLLNSFPAPEVTLFGKSDRQVITGLQMKVDAQGKTIVPYRFVKLSLSRKYLP